MCLSGNLKTIQYPIQSHTPFVLGEGKKYSGLPTYNNLHWLDPNSRNILRHLHPKPSSKFISYGNKKKYIYYFGH